MSKASATPSSTEKLALKIVAAPYGVTDRPVAFRSQVVVNPLEPPLTTNLAFHQRDGHAIPSGPLAGSSSSGSPVAADEKARNSGSEEALQATSEKGVSFAKRMRVANSRARQISSRPNGAVESKLDHLISLSRFSGQLQAHDVGSPSSIRCSNSDVEQHFLPMDTVDDLFDEEEEEDGAHVEKLPRQL